MIVDCDFNITEYRWRTLDEIMPYPQYNAGSKDNDKPVYQDPKDSTSNPILTLEFDILNEDGYGLKRGYYEIATDYDYTYLMFVQAGKIKAKIPIVKEEIISEYGSEFEWADDKDKSTPNTASKNLDYGISVSSKQIYKKEYTEKELKKRREKYKKGMDPSLYFHSKVYMEYDKELDLYKVIWEKYNTRLIAILKTK